MKEFREESKHDLGQAESAQLEHRHGSRLRFGLPCQPMILCTEAHFCPLPDLLSVFSGTAIPVALHSTPGAAGCQLRCFCNGAGFPFAA